MFAFAFARRGYFSHGLTHALDIVLITLFLGFFLYTLLQGEQVWRAPGPEHMTLFLLFMTADGADGEHCAVVRAVVAVFRFMGIYDAHGFCRSFIAPLLSAEQKKVIWRRCFAVLGIGLPIGVLPI